MRLVQAVVSEGGEGVETEQATDKVEAADGERGVASLDMAAMPEPFPVTDLTRSLAQQYKYLKSGSGWYEENNYLLRADGTFAFALGSSVFGESYDHAVSGYAYNRSNPTGYWKAEGTSGNGIFTFKHGDGSVETRDYWENNQGHFIVGGMRWFRV